MTSLPGGIQSQQPTAQDPQLLQIYQALLFNQQRGRDPFFGFNQQQIQLWQTQGQAWADRNLSPVTQQVNLFQSQTTGFDEQGFPTGVNRPPPADVALQFQFLSERAVAERNALRRRDAIRSLGQARTVFESFRPGGASALAAGIPQQQAQFLFADQIDAPDLLSDFRRNEAFQSRRRSNRARNTQLAVQAGTALVKAATTIATSGGGDAGQAMIGPPSSAATGQGTTAPLSQNFPTGFVPSGTKSATVGGQQAAQAGIIAPQGGELQPGQASGGAVPGAPVPQGPVGGQPEGGPAPEARAVGGAGDAAAPQVPGADLPGAVPQGSPVSVGDMSGPGMVATAHRGMGPIGDPVATIIAADEMEMSEPFYDQVDGIVDGILAGLGVAV